MIGLCILALFPAFVLSKSVVSSDIIETQVCQYFDARIQRFEDKVKEMKELVDVDSEFYRTLEASNLCDTVGRVAVPECVANHEGDECVAAKIESIKKPLLRAIKVDKSGKEFFDYCKYIGYKNVLKTFLQTRKLMSGECGLPGQKLNGDREPRNSLLLPLLVAGAYDPSSIWFQYFLCKDQQIYCYFFTQGWNQYEYGQYYLYENLLDDTDGIFGGSTDSSNLATLALLGGLGGGSPHSRYYPSSSDYSQASVGRKRRGSDDSVCLDNPNTDGCSKRKRHDVDCDNNLDAQGCRERRDADTEYCKNIPGAQGCRERRDADVEFCDNNPDAQGCRKRRDVDAEFCENNPDAQGCRKRRDADTEYCKNNPGAQGCRKRRDADAELCKNNPGAQGCRKRRDADTEYCKINPGAQGCRKRRDVDAEFCENNPGAQGCRKLRDADVEFCDNNPDAQGCRKRRDADAEFCKNNPGAQGCRKRRNVDAEFCENNPGSQRCRERRDADAACDSCENNPDSIDCKDCPKHM